MRPLVEALVTDGTGTVKAAFFNQPWLVRRYPPGTRLLLHGRLRSRGAFNVEAHARTSEPLGGGGSFVSHYPATDGLTSTQIHSMVRELGACLREVIEPLPAALRASERLPDREAALRAIHFPDAVDALDPARARLAFEELLLLQLALMRRRAARETEAARVLDEPPEFTASWLGDLLPFALTGDQARAIAEVDRDLASSRPMQRC